MRTHGFRFRPQVAVRWMAAGAGILATGYGTYAEVSWSRFGRMKSAHPDELLDRFMPDYDVADSHNIRIAAPAETALAAAQNMDLLQAPVIRWIFKAREFMMGSMPQPESEPDR